MLDELERAARERQAYGVAIHVRGHSKSEYVYIAHSSSYSPGNNVPNADKLYDHDV